MPAPFPFPFTSVVGAGMLTGFGLGGSGAWLWFLCTSGVFHGSSGYSIEVFAKVRGCFGEDETGADLGGFGGVIGRWGGFAAKSEKLS